MFGLKEKDEEEKWKTGNIPNSIRLAFLNDRNWELIDIVREDGTSIFENIGKDFSYVYDRTSNLKKRLKEIEDELLEKK